jgi:hypothetical protein
LSHQSNILAVELNWLSLEDPTNDNNNIGRRAFLGWAGESSTSPGIEISYHFAQLLGLKNGQKVFVKPLPSGAIQPATSVSVEPLSEDDWEIVVRIRAFMLDRDCIGDSVATP